MVAPLDSTGNVRLQLQLLLVCRLGERVNLSTINNNEDEEEEGWIDDDDFQEPGDGEDTEDGAIKNE